MDDSQYLFRKLLVSCFFAVALCDVTSFSLKPGSQSLSGESVSLICTLDSYTNLISIFKSADKTSTYTAFSECSQTICRNLKEGYSFTITENTVEITIDRLQRAEDQNWWTCRTTDSNSQRSEKQFYLTVYTIPSSITLNEPTGTCDLGQSRCEYTCTTDQCTYPPPAFTWLYVFDDDTTAVISHTISYNDRANSCADSTKIYEAILTFQRYELFNGNVHKTVRLQCVITFTGLSSGKRTSGVSQNVIFAEKVSAVQILDGTDVLTDNTFTVNENEEKLLNCIPGNGNPTPTVQWFVGNTPVATGSEFRFSPVNSHHGQQIYCVADNIPNNDLDDAVSNKPTLYVKVKIQFAYIEAAADSVLSVIEDTPEPVLCRTSAGRPSSTIEWFKKDTELGSGNSTAIEFADNSLEVTKSTIYVKVSRSDIGWTLSCTASNYDGAARIWANNSKSFNVLYPPEHMSFEFAGKPVVGPVIDVKEGTSGTLKCAASSNPPVSEFSWNVNDINGDTLTIDESIQNNQKVNCTARNIMTSTAGILINGYGSISKTINVQYAAIIKRMEINGNTGNTTLKENDPVLIACYVDSNPDAVVSLFQASYLLVENERSRELVYNISSAQCSHTSQYTCRADNGISNTGKPVTKTVQLNVECSPRLAFETDSSIYAQENRSVVLSLRVLAYPFPTQHSWFKNISNRWKEVRRTPIIQMTYSSERMIHAKFDLILMHVKAEDYGEYKLTIDNSIGSPLNFTFVLLAHATFPTTRVPANSVDDNKVQSSTLAAVAGAMGTVLVIVIVVLVILVLIIWRNHISVTFRKEDNLTYEMPNRATQGSGDRTYDIVNQSFNEYEDSAQ